MPQFSLLTNLAKSCISKWRKPVLSIFCVGINKGLTCWILHWGTPFPLNDTSQRPFCHFASDFLTTINEASDRNRTKSYRLILNNSLDDGWSVLCTGICQFHLGLPVVWYCMSCLWLASGYKLPQSHTFTRVRLHDLCSWPHAPWCTHSSSS